MPAENLQPAPVVLLAGGFLDPRTWEDVVAALARDGVTAHTLDLPSIPPDDRPAGDLQADVAALTDHLSAHARPVVLCAHSYAGMVATEAAGGPHPQVAELVYLTAAAPDAGQTLADLAPRSDPDNGDDHAAEEVAVERDGTIRLLPDAARTTLLHDCPPATVERTVAGLRRMNPAVGSQPVTRAAWRDLPATYVRGTLDRMPELLTAEFLPNVREQLDLPTGHCPQLSQPDLVTDLLAARARAAASQNRGEPAKGQR